MYLDTILYNTQYYLSYGLQLSIVIVEKDPHNKNKIK